MMIDAASERSEQGRFLSKSPVSSNAVLDNTGASHGACIETAIPKMQPIAAACIHWRIVTQRFPCSV